MVFRLFWLFSLISAVLYDLYFEKIYWYQNYKVIEHAKHYDPEGSISRGFYKLQRFNLFFRYNAIAVSIIALCDWFFKGLFFS